MSTWKRVTLVFGLGLAMLLVMLAAVAAELSYAADPNSTLLRVIVALQGFATGIAIGSMLSRAIQTPR